MRFIFNEWSGAACVGFLGGISGFLLEEVEGWGSREGELVR